MPSYVNSYVEAHHARLRANDGKLERPYRKLLACITAVLDIHVWQMSSSLNEESLKQPNYTYVCCQPVIQHLQSVCPVPDQHFHIMVFIVIAICACKVCANQTPGIPLWTLTSMPGGDL